MKEVFSASECFIAIKLDMSAIQDLHLDVNVHSVRQSILKGNFGETRPRVLRDLKPQHVAISAGGHKVMKRHGRYLNSHFVFVFLFFFFVLPFQSIYLHYCYFFSSLPDACYDGACLTALFLPSEANANAYDWWGFSTEKLPPIKHNMPFTAFCFRHVRRPTS